MCWCSFAARLAYRLVCKALDQDGGPPVCVPACAPLQTAMGPPEVPFLTLDDSHHLAPDPAAPNHLPVTLQCGNLGWRVDSPLAGGIRSPGPGPSPASPNFTSQ